MKKFSRLMALVLALGLMLCLCACDSNGNADNTTENSENTLQSTETTENTKNNETTENTEDSTKVAYTVTVVDENNAPIAGAWVQLCLEACVPGTTNDQGVAEFSLEENDYKVSIMVMPEGYTYSTEETEWHFAEGESSLTIVLSAVDTAG